MNSHQRRVSRRSSKRFVRDAVKRIRAEQFAVPPEFVDSPMAPLFALAASVFATRVARRVFDSPLNASRAGSLGGAIASI